MAKPEWGVKRTCQSCGARFYDLLRQPPVCPTCNTEFVPEPTGRGRKGARATPVAIPEPKKVEEDIDDIEDIEDDDDDDDSLIESTDDLSEDDDDVAEVKEHIETNDDDKS